MPDLTPITTVNGPGTVQVTGQEVRWSVPVSAGQPVTLTIRTSAAITPSLVTNRAVFSSTQVLNREVTLLIYSSQLSLPLVLR